MRELMMRVRMFGNEKPRRQRGFHRSRARGTQGDAEGEERQWVRLRGDVKPVIFIVSRPLLRTSGVEKRARKANCWDGAQEA